MPTSILVAGTQLEQIQAAFSGLDSPYICVVCASPLTAEEHLHKTPALVLLQVDAVWAQDLQWCAFARSCEQSGIPTILFNQQGCSGEQMRQTFPWCEGVMKMPPTAETLSDYLNVHLHCHELKQQLELAQGRLFEKNLELDEGLRSAAYIQKTLMPSEFPDLPQLHFASRFIPCETVGGDIFNVLRLDEQTVMVYMLDVSGHGVSAAMVTVSIFQALSLHTGQILKHALKVPPFYQITSPAEVLRRLDNEYPIERFDKFFTISYFLINPHTGEIRYASAAHPPAVVVRADGELQHLDAEGTIIGLGGIVPYEEEQVVLSSGDRLFLCTDGVIEHENNAAELFGQQRFDTVLREQRQQPLDEHCQSVIDAIREFGGAASFRDDVTLLGLSFGVDNTH